MGTHLASGGCCAHTCLCQLSLPLPGVSSYISIAASPVLPSLQAMRPSCPSQGQCPPLTERSRTAGALRASGMP